MTTSRDAAPGSLLRSTAAEFSKFYAFRIPQIAYASIAAFLLLFVIELFYVEGVSGTSTVADVIPYLFFDSWKTSFFQLFIIAFSAYCIAVDSQYGMIRIGCTQPVSRTQYLLAKSIAIELHVALFTLVYVASLLMWVCICTRFRGLSATDVPALVSLTARTVVLCCGLSGCMIGVSTLRKTLLDAFVCCCVVFVGFAFLAMLRERYHLQPALFLRYYFYPIAGILPKGWSMPIPMKDAPFWQFLLVSLGTPAVCFLPALVHFHFRDISE
jgi:ABC-type transport system involved in multi-copper enzyme maturation permease subunit